MDLTGFKGGAWTCRVSRRSALGGFGVEWGRLPAADADYLAGAGRIAMLARDAPLARALFLRALERDRSSYRAALDVASTLLLQRDFDSASRAFDATRNRTHDKDEQTFLTFTIGDLATITAR